LHCISAVSDFHNCLLQLIIHNSMLMRYRAKHNRISD
jgi:hypothetical protein